jgi:uncharacterized protein
VDLLYYRGRLPESGFLHELLVLIGTIAPALVAVGITWREGGQPGITVLLDGVFQWQVQAGWYLFALGYTAVIRLAVALAARTWTGSWPQLVDSPLALAPAAILISMPVQAGEEIGWRGYALPRLMESMGFTRASVFLGIVWAVWHLPLFYLRVSGNDEYGQSFPVWALGVTALSVAFAWLYVRTGGSLLLTMLMHAAVNNLPHFAVAPATDTSNVFSLHASAVTWFTALFLWIPAAYLISIQTAARPLDSPKLPGVPEESSR